MSIRPATHAGSWYTADSVSLQRLISRHFANALPSQKGARVLVGPHAGYTYCGDRLAETYSVWDTANVRRVFILGPSHHAYFRDAALLSPYHVYETPLGNLPVDHALCEKLAAQPPFKYMSKSVDDEEHSFEMHAPFLVHRCLADGVELPQIVPIMISGLSSKSRQQVVDQLVPYMDDPTNTFVVSSDFCHWGARFGYTQYVAGNDISQIGPYSSARDHTTPIYESIEHLDRGAMVLASAGSVKKWDAYIEQTGNTICGQKPIAIVLAALEEYKKRGGRTASERVFEWAGYSQSGQALRVSDSSVSYASGYVRLDDRE